MDEQLKASIDAAVRGGVNKSFDQYVASDERLLNKRADLEKSIDKKLTFETLVNLTSGVRKIHYIDYNGTRIPMRLLSIQEEINIKHETHIEFQKYPMFLGSENHPLFSRIEVIKLLSRATSAAPEILDQAFLSEKAVSELPAVAFDYLYKQYLKLQYEYNIEYNDTLETDINYIIATIFDGLPLNEKKLNLLSGLTSSIQLQIIIRLCNVISELEDNTHFITLLEELNPKETPEKQES